MSNRALWNVRLRHESLSKPKKANHLKRRKRLRIGLEAALERAREKLAAEESTPPPSA